MRRSTVEAQRHRKEGPGALLLALACAASAVLPTVAIAQDTGSVTGQVVNGATGQALSGAQVVIVGLGMGTLTQSNGRFLIPGVPAGSHTVRAILLGFGSEEARVAIAAGETALAEFELSPQALDLEEIVVTGTAGAARRREVGNAIASIRAQEIEAQTITSTQDVLTGSVAGLQINMNEGAPGAGGTIRIRGVNSLTQGNRPLIYVDGVRMENGELPGTYSSASRSPLNDINPDDIARVEVIKGAAATTLYGTEASGGVIQVFTKRGTTGRPQWQLEITQGVASSPPIGPEPPAEFLQLYPDGENLFMDQHLRTAWNQEYNLSVRGGSPDGVRYFVSGGWLDQEGVLPKQANEQLNLRANLSFSPTDWIVIDFTNSLSQAHNVWVPLGNPAKSFSLNVFRGPFDYVEDQDTVFLTEYDVQSRTNHFISGLQFGLNPSQNLSAKLVLGLDYIDDDYHETEIFGALREPEGIRQARRWTSETRTIDFAATYDRPLGGFSTATSAGFQVFQNRLLEVEGTSRDFAGPGNPTLDTGSRQNASEDRLEEVNAGFFVQEVLGLGDRLFITAGLRVDGNSAFGEDYGLQSYPKLSASYVISDESFWPDIFGSTKLRAAYGESGRAPGYFDAQRTWDPISTLEGQPGVTPANQGNPELGPERTREIEAGLETSLLEDRLFVSLTGYRQLTTDALIAVPQDPSLGYLDSQVRNVGQIENRGLEILANATLLRGSGYTWDLGASMSFSESEVVDLGGVQSIFLGGSLSPGMFARVGYPLPGYFGAVVQNPDERAAPVTEEEYLGPMYPTRLINLNTNIRVGDDLTLTGSVEHQGGHHQLSHTSYRNTQRSVWPDCFLVAQKVDAGRVDELTARERWRCSPSDVDWAAHVWPLDFWKLRSVAVNYRLPEDLFGGRFGQLGVSVGGRNLWTIHTRYQGVDPEASQGGDSLARHEYYQMPVPRTFTFTIQTRF